MQCLSANETVQNESTTMAKYTIDRYSETNCSFQTPVSYEAYLGVATENITSRLKIRQKHRENEGWGNNDEVQATDSVSIHGSEYSMMYSNYQVSIELH